MVIHDRDEGDACEVGNFLSVYRCGQAWSRWGFARAGRAIRAWCCLTGADVGQFACLDDALAAVLEAAPVSSAKTVTVRNAPVTNLVAFRTYAKRLGSAA
jgi:hypothetical protein